MNYYVFLNEDEVSKTHSMVNRGFSLKFKNGVRILVNFGDGTLKNKGATHANVIVVDCNNNRYEFKKNKLHKCKYGSISDITSDDLVTIMNLAKQLQFSVSKSNKKQNLKPPPPPPDRIIIEGKIPDPPRDY